MAQRSTTLQFSDEQFKEMEEYIDSGYYSSKSELVREAVRDKLTKLKESELYRTVLKLRKKSKDKGAKIESPVLSKKDGDKILEQFIKNKGLKL